MNQVGRPVHQYVSGSALLGTPTNISPPEYQQRLVERLTDASDTLSSLNSGGLHSFVRRREIVAADKGKGETPLSSAAQACTELALERCECCAAGIAKKLIFALRRQPPAPVIEEGSTGM
jgi:hypothetical protein